jgi:hypothetical protein
MHIPHHSMLLHMSPHDALSPIPVLLQNPHTSHISTENPCKQSCQLLPLIRTPLSKYPSRKSRQSFGNEALTLVGNPNPVPDFARVGKDVCAGFDADAADCFVGVRGGAEDVI